MRRPFPLRDAPGGKNREGGGRKKTGTAGRTIVTLFRGEEFIARTVPGGGIRPAACENKQGRRCKLPHWSREPFLEVALTPKPSRHEAGT